MATNLLRNRPAAWRACLLASLCFCLLAGGASPAPDPLAPLAPRQVRVGGEIGRRIQITIDRNLLALDADKDFLPAFAQRDKSGGYVGLGKLIDAAAHFGAYSGDPRVLALKRHLTGEALRLQGLDGYIGMIDPAHRVSALWDVHEMGYLVEGLTSDYKFFGEKASLAGAKKLADFIITHWPAEAAKLPGAGQMTLHMAVTGSELAMLSLYTQTHDQRYLDFCLKTRRLAEWDAHIATGRFTPLEGHAYAHLSRCVAQLRTARLFPEMASLLKPTHDVMDFMLHGEGMTIPGEVGDHECWHDTQEGTMNLGESCATAYLLRFFDEQLRMQNDSRYGDLMERVIYNGLFAAQSPDGRKIRYYTPFEGPRTYYNGDTFCCPNNYRRIVAELPGFIYYQSGGGVTVNLYTSSTALLSLPGRGELRVTQQTQYPAAGHVEVTLDPARPARFPLRLRLPAWCAAPAIAVNGEEVPVRQASGRFMSLDREWKSGDKITLELPMAVRLVKGRRTQAGRVALMRGPQLFGLAPAGEPKLAGANLRVVVIDPATVSGPVADASVRPGGLALGVKAWRPGVFYPSPNYQYTLKLTEYADPGCEAIYFKVPNPNDPMFVEDELF